jgi:hypothetical protein
MLESAAKCCNYPGMFGTWKASNEFVFSINPLFLSSSMVHEAHYLRHPAFIT